jgi:hypothetical protein
VKQTKLRYWPFNFHFPIGFLGGLGLPGSEPFWSFGYFVGVRSLSKNGLTSFENPGSVALNGGTRRSVLNRKQVIDSARTARGNTSATNRSLIALDHFRRWGEGMQRW